ncbi:MAG: hypothetical protein NE334_19060 [Lentisphaeraceae bacterium]|nr:hypothetical protein [Lentisphaeraceae bacterium]
MGLTYIQLLFTAAFLTFPSNLFAQETKALHPKKEDFDKALGSFAEGLLLFDDFKPEGMFFLTESVRLAPDNTKLVDAWLEHAQKRILSEASFGRQESDFHRHRFYILQALFPIARDNPHASYLHLKLIETCIELDNRNLAEYLRSNLREDENDPYLAWADLLLRQQKDSPEYEALITKISKNIQLQQHYDLQYFLLQKFAELDSADLSQVRLKQALKVIESLETWELNPYTRLRQYLGEAVLMESDLSEAKRTQLISKFYDVSPDRQWNAFALVLMDLKYYKQADVILRKFVLPNAQHKWRTFYNLSICALRLEQKKERVDYLEKALAIKTGNITITRSLAAALLNVKQYQKALNVLKNIRPQKDYFYLKLKFYIHKNLGHYQTAFELAEKLYNWPVLKERKRVITASLGLSSLEVYQKLRRQKLLLHRLKLCLSYNTKSDSLKNGTAYFLAESDFDLEFAASLAEEVVENSPETAAFLDTLAWIKFKQGLYSQAWELIQQAVDLDERKSGVILMHAGDICKANDGWFSSFRARSFWQDALEADQSLKLEIEKRLK